MRAELIFIGTELLLGEIVNTHALTLTRSLADEGVDVHRLTTVGDNLGRAAQAIAEAMARADVVVCTGGLGPMLDDVTREALAQAADRPLVPHRPSREAIEAYLASRGRAPGMGDLRQALLPEGAEALPNARGTAPGISLRHGDVLVFCLPGPPSELVPMWEEQVLPALRAERARRGEPTRRLWRRVLRVAGLPEAVVEERLRDLMAAADPTLAPYAKPLLEVQLRLATKAATAEEAEAKLGPLEAEIRSRLGAHVFGRDDETLPAAVGALLRARGLRLVLAESCTGGLIGDLITDVPGSSAYFVGAVVAYADDVKRGLLAVPAGTLAAHGAVSAETARAMAAGALRATGADVALAVTGIAGPGGGSPAKPVGTVWVCVRQGERELVRRLQLRGDRREVKLRAAGAALALLRGFLLDLPGGGVL